MTLGQRVPQWTLGVVAGALCFGAVSAQAAPIPSGVGDSPAIVHRTQYFYDGPDYYDPPPPPRYYGPPPGYRRPPPPPPGYYGPPRGYYNREAAKEYMKDYKRAQKEVAKDQIRSWNRRNGF